MCKFTIFCPLCCSSSFTSIASLRTSLIKAIDSPIKCPVCNEIVNGLDKLTLHLISHNGIINLTSNSNNNNNNNNCDNNYGNDNNITNNCDNNNNNNLNNNIATFEIINDGILINTNKNQMQQQINLHSQQQQRQQQQIIQQNHINQNVNDNLNLNNPAHAFYFKNEPIKFITPIVLTPDFLNNTTMSALASSSSSSSSSTSSSPTSSLVTSTLMSRESHMIPSNITKTNHCNQEIQLQQQQQQQQQQNNIFNNGTGAILHLNQSVNNNLPSNLIIIKSDNDCNNLIKSDENQDRKKINSSNYGKFFFNTQAIEEQPTRYCDEHRCDICGITFSSVEVFKKHVQVMHQIPLETNDIKSTIPKITTTTTVANNVAQGLYQCHLCSKSYKIKARLRLHLKVKHCLNINPTNTNNNNNNNNNNCNEINENNETKLKICEKIRILTTNLNATNNNIDNAIIPIKIEKIDISNDNIINQNIHDIQNVKTEPIPKPWKCDICSKFYTTKYFLKKHKRIHTGETPYKCNICSKTFTFQQSYHKHLLYHSDDKPHVCKICNRAFKELSTLHNHERIHSGEKPFECEICGKRFRQRVSNYVHQRTHTGAKPYSCESCFRKFRYKVTLRTHKCSILHESLKVEKIQLEYNNENLEKLSNDIKIENLENKIEKFKDNHDNILKNLSPTISREDENLQKLLQNVEILPGSDDLLSNTIASNLICHNNDFKDNQCDIIKERANKSIDELVAESCNKLGIGSCNNIEMIQNYGNAPMTNDTPSPSEQLQHLCLYSPNAIEENLNVNLNINDDSFKQFLFEIENSKNS